MKCLIIRFFILFLLLAQGFVSHARTYLVSVGVADYSEFPEKINNLNLTTFDAKTIADLYSKNTSVDYALLLNEKATKERIVKAIKKVFNQAGEDDMVVFFFSGHGYPGGFCAYNGKITYGEVRDAMAESKCKNKMMFVDACRSGGIRVDNKVSKNEENSANASNIMLLLSSRNNENSIERKGMKNGFFTTYLQKGLRGNADSNKDRIITAKELFDFVHSGVKWASAESQHPVMWGNFSDDMPVMKW